MTIMLDHPARNNELDRLGPRPLLPSLDAYGSACPRRGTDARSSPGVKASISSTAPARRASTPFAGLYCVNVGYGRQKIADAIAEQATKLAYYHAYVGHGTDALDHALQDDHRPCAGRA
jgi:hypothetical protein